MPMPDLDTIDHRIIAARQEDGRLSNVDLAERVGLSPSPCLRRVKRLERDGTIAAYRALPQRSRIGLGLTVFIGVKIDGHGNERAAMLEEAILAMPEVIAAHMVSGEADYLVEVVVPDLEHYQRFPRGQAVEPTGGQGGAQQFRHSDAEGRSAVAARPSDDRRAIARS